jgi:hypothetical protein
MKFTEGGGNVHKLIRSILKEKKCLRREDINKELQKRFGFYEGDIGRRLRDMNDVVCSQAWIRAGDVNKRIWLYRLVKV